MKLRNLRPFAFEIAPAGKPGIYAGAPGETDEKSGAPADVFDVVAADGKPDVDLAASLLDQPDNFAPADAQAERLLAQLGELAAAADAVDEVVATPDAAPVRDAGDVAAPAPTDPAVVDDAGAAPEKD